MNIVLVIEPQPVDIPFAADGPPVVFVLLIKFSQADILFAAEIPISGHCTGD